MLQLLLTAANTENRVTYDHLIVNHCQSFCTTLLLPMLIRALQEEGMGATGFFYQLLVVSQSQLSLRHWRQIPTLLTRSFSSLAICSHGLLHQQIVSCSLISAENGYRGILGHTLLWPIEEKYTEKVRHWSSSNAELEKNLQPTYKRFFRSIKKSPIMAIYLKTTTVKTCRSYEMQINSLSS